MGKKKKVELGFSVVTLQTKATVKPTGQAISRSGGKFTFSWKIADKDYSDGEWLRYRVNGGNWTGAIKLSNSKATSYTVDLSSSIGSVKSIAFQIKGKRADYYSGKGKSLIYVEMNTSALLLFAMRARSMSSTKTSVLRV